LTVQEVAHFLHVSEDTVRRQVRQGQLEAVHLGKTPTGRVRLRIPRTALDKLMGSSSTQRQDPVATLRALFAQLEFSEQERLIDEAVLWARGQRGEEQGQSDVERPEITPEEIALRFPGGRRVRGQG